MSNMEKIKAEIERMHQQAVLASYGNDTDLLRSRIATCVDILAFIDSLPEEKPSEDLEDAAEDSWALYEYRETPQGLYSSCYRDGFIAGAKWQANQLLKGSSLPEDTVLFSKGVAEGRRLEMEELPRWKKGPAASEIRTRDYWPVSNAPVLGKPETRDYLIVKRGESLLLAFHAEEGDYYLSTEELDKIPTE